MGRHRAKDNRIPCCQALDDYAVQALLLFSVERYQSCEILVLSKLYAKTVWDYEPIYV